jgi:outer membrane usher protein
VSNPRSFWECRNLAAAIVLASGLTLGTGATRADERGSRVVRNEAPPDNARGVTAHEATPARPPPPWLLAQQSQSPPAPSGAPQEALLLVDINKQGLNETILFLRDASGRVYAAVQDLKRWRLPVPEVPPLTYRGVQYYPLQALRGLVVELNEAKQTLDIKAPAQLFSGTKIDAELQPGVAMTRPGTGGFLNYSLLGERTSGVSQTSGSFELGFFNRFGVGIGTYLANDLGADAQLTRLETTWTYDMPDKIASWRFGDGVNRTGTWGRGVRFGGIQYATNFATQPGLVTLPRQLVAGEAIVPSTVDVFVNNALVSRQQVPPGPFSITNVPVVTGSGAVRLVVRDEFGREQVITRPFYTSPVLLREGLTDVSYELGFLREDLGIRSNSYGSWVGSASYRHGWSDNLTSEFRGEAQDGLYNAGASGDYLISGIGVVSGTLAAGQNPVGTGELWALGFDRAARPLSFNVRSQWTSPDFRQVGQLPGQLPPARQSTAGASYALGVHGSVGVAYVSQAFRDQPDVDVRSIGYNTSVGKFAFVSISASQTRSTVQSTNVALTLTIPLGTRTSMTASANRTRNSDGTASEEIAATVQRNLPPGDGWGYRLRASDSGPRQAELSMQNRVGTYVAEVAEHNDQTGARLNIAGGIGMIGGTAFLSRTITDSFGLVRVPGIPGVRVYADNHEIGRTDEQGEMIVPRLRPYQKNPVGIELLDLPLDSKIDALRLDAVPYSRSGLVIEFPVKRTRGAILQILLEDGQPLPAGAVVKPAEQAEEFPVALNGEVYVTDLERTNRIRAFWRGQSCEIEFGYPETSDPQPRLGPFVCKGVKR